MKKNTLLLAVTASLLSTTAFTQVRADSVTTLNQIVIEETRKDGENKVDITQEDLTRSNPTDLQDVFISEPTISVGGPTPISQKLYVNGVEETNLAVTIDGSRQNNKTFHHNGTTYIDPALLQAVSINPGVAPADAGPGALAGSVEYETKDAKSLLKEGENFGGFAVAEYDTNGNTFAPSGAIFGRENGFEFLAYAKLADGNKQKDGAGDIMFGSDTGVLSLLGKIAYEAQAGDRLEVSYERVQDASMRPFRANTIIIGHPTASLLRKYDLVRTNAVITYTDEKPQGMWDPKIQLAYSETDLSVLFPTENAYSQASSINGKIQNKFPLEKGSVTAGVDFYYDETAAQYVPDGFDGSEKSRNVGAFAQWRINPSDQLFLSFGGRADVNQLVGENGYKETNEGFSGNASADYKINDIFTIGAGVSHVFGGIKMMEGFHLYNTMVYSSNLKPTTADNGYLAVRADFDNFFVKGKVFKTYINRFRDDGFGNPVGTTRDAETEGFELGAGVNWDGGFFKVGFTSIDSKIDGNTADTDTGQYLIVPIGEIFTIGAAHNFAGTGITVGADAEFVLKNTDTVSVDLPGYEVVNAYVQYTPETYQNLTFRIEGNNLFDEAYADRTTYGGEYANVAPLMEPGRSVKFTIRTEF